METKEIRKKNINDLCNHYGRDIVAKKMGYPDTVYINQLCGGHVDCGAKTARKMEAALNLQKGFLDIPHEESNPKLSQYIDIIKEIIARSSPDECEKIVDFARYIDHLKENSQKL